MIVVRRLSSPRRACPGTVPCGDPGRASALSEKDASRLLNLVPLLLFAERKRVSKGNCARTGTAGTRQAADESCIDILKKKY